MRESDSQLLGGDIRQIFLRYLLPSVGGMLGNSLYILGDTIMVGRALGGPGLSAVNIAIPVIKIVNSIGLITGVGGATALAVSRGRGDYETGNQIFNLSMKLGFIAGLLVTIWNLYFLDSIVVSLGATAYSYELTKTYMRVIATTTIFKVFSIALGLFIRNDGSPNLVMVASLGSSLFNVVFDYILIFIFDLGIWGGAVATALSPIVSLMILSLHFIKGKNELKFEKTSYDFQVIKRIVLNGVPSALIELSAGIVIYIFNIILLKIVGDIGISAYSVIANLSLVGNSIFSGMGQAIQPIVSMNYGAEKMERVYEAMKLGVVVSLVTGIFFYIIGLIWPDGLAKLFMSDTGELLRITSQGIKIYFSAFIFMGINIVITSYIQSMEEYRISTFISLLRGSILIVLVLLIFSKLFGLKGVWLTVSVVEFLTLIICILAFKDIRDAVKYIFGK